MVFESFVTTVRDRFALHCGLAAIQENGHGRMHLLEPRVDVTVQVVGWALEHTVWLGTFWFL
jgi:hypothetical protein